MDEIFDMGEEDKKVLALQLADWDSARRSKVRSLDAINSNTYALWTYVHDQTEFINPVQRLASGLVQSGSTHALAAFLPHLSNPCPHCQLVLRFLP